MRPNKFLQREFTHAHTPNMDTLFFVLNLNDVGALVRASRFPCASPRHIELVARREDSRRTSEAGFY